MVLDIGWNWDFFMSWSCTVALDKSLSVGIHKGWMATSKIKRCQRHGWVIYMGNQARHTNVGLFTGHSICWYSDQFDITHLGWKPSRHSLLILLQVISHGCCCYASKTLGHMHRSCTVERQHFTSVGIWIVLPHIETFFLDSDYWISTTLPYEDRASSTDLATLFGKQKWFRNHQIWLKIWAPQSGLKLSAGSFLHIAAIASFVLRKNNCPGFNGSSEPCQPAKKRALCCEVKRITSLRQRPSFGLAKYCLASSTVDPKDRWWSMWVSGLEVRNSCFPHFSYNISDIG